MIAPEIVRLAYQVEQNGAYAIIINCLSEPGLKAAKELLVTPVFGLLEVSLPFMPRKPYIANYFKSRKNSGFVEGLNNKINVMKRRCYGFMSTETIFQRLALDLNGAGAYA